jgi:mannosyltransferase
MTLDSLPTAPALPAKRLADAAWAGRSGTLARLRASRWATVALLFTLTVVSSLLRTRQLNFYYWVDEGISVGISSHHLSQLPALLREDGSPPLYYLLLHAWMQIWGRGETATHVLSLIWALVAIPVAYWAGASVFDRRTGIYCAVLAAGLPFLTIYAQETRMYSLVLVESIVVAASFLHVFVRGRRRFVPVFVASLTAALYTHNWALFLGLACFASFLAVAWLTPAGRPRLRRDGALAFGSVAVLYFPWLPTLLYQAKHTGAPWAAAPDVWSLTTGSYFLVGGRGAAVALLLAAGSGLLAVRSSTRSQGPTWTMVTALSVAGLGTLAVAWLYAKLSPAWSPRYLAVIVGPLLLLVGFGLRRAGRLGIVALVLVCCFWVLDPVVHTRDAKSSVASAAAAIRPRLGADPLVLSTQPEQVPTLAYYLPRVTRFGTPLGPVADPRVTDWHNALKLFRRSSVQAVLVPLIRTLLPGQRIALVVPTLFAKTPLWAKLIHRTSVIWARYLKHDARLRLLKVVSPDSHQSVLPVRISLFAATGPGTTPRAR